MLTVDKLRMTRLTVDVGRGSLARPLVGTESAWAVSGKTPEQRMILSLTDNPAHATRGASRRVFEPIIGWDADGPIEPVRVRVMTLLTVPTQHEGELAAWYAEEHAHALLSIPGWLHIGRYRLVHGSGPTLLALHDLASEEPLHSPGYQAALPTPWGDRIFAAATEMARCVLVRHETSTGTA